MKSGTKLNMPIFIVGATGTGKSAAAMELARALDGAKGAAILCLDAMQVYRGADIGTSKPAAAERTEIPHGGLDLVEFGASFDVAQYLKHAAAFLREQAEAGRRVMVVGGTGLYFRALTQGLCEAPRGSEELRAELASRTTKQLYARLQRVDPAMLERIDRANPRRLARAIEVMEATGRSLRTWQEETPEPLVKEFRAIWIQREKRELEARIEARVEAMFAQGWVEEVRGLVKRYGVEAVQGFAGIGYREIAEGMQDEITKFPNSEEAVMAGREADLILRQTRVDGEEKGAARQYAAAIGLRRNILVSTRQYAKRQLTWFARERNLRQVMLTGNQSFSAALAMTNTWPSDLF